MGDLIRRVVVAGSGAVLAAVLAVAPAGPVAAGGPPVLAFTPSPFDFGPVAVGQTAAQTFTLANSGGSASRALTVTLSGSAEFTVTADTCTGTSLGPGKSCTVTVQFAPASAGTATAALTASHKKTVRATDPLTGTGVVPAHLYWTTMGDGTVHEASLAGSSPKAIVTGQNGPALMAIDGSRIYWADNRRHGHGGQPGRHRGDHPGVRAELPGRCGGGQQPHLLGRQQQRHDHEGQPGRHRGDHPGLRPERTVRGGGGQQPHLLDRQRS